MSKRKDKSKKEETNKSEKFIPDNQIETYQERVLNNKKNGDILSVQVNQINDKFKELHINHIKNTEKITKNLEEKQRENAYLYEEIREIRDKREEFEKNCKENFEKKFEEVEEERIKAIESITKEMNILKEDLDKSKEEKKELEEKVRKLEAEIERLNHVNNITKNNYINKINDLNQKHHIKIKNTIDRFESFLSNNQELLDKQCVEFKKKNSELEKINREFKLDMDNNEDIINACAQEQINIKKKTEKLNEELAEKNKMIDLVKNEYQKQVDLINDKYSQILNENSLEIENLKNQIEDRNKRILLAQQNSKEVINSRSELELFFIDQLKECRKEIIKKRKKENDKKNCYLPYLNKSSNLESKNNTNNNNSTITQDDIYITSMKKVDIKDMDPELKEKLLRNLLIKFNEGGIAKGFKKLRNEIK